MPAPYPLIPVPPGDFKNMFDYQAMNMACAHNTFIQGINAMVAHAPNVPTQKVQPFMVFCIAVIETIGHHHHLEETFLFPEYEKKLGKGALAENVEQHERFVPQLAELEKHLKDIQSGKADFDGNALVEEINLFSDIMVEHLTDEISTLDSDRMRKAFTEKELKDMDAAFFKLALERIDFYIALPWGLCCANPATPWFPPFPLPLKWATRLWFSRRHREAWEFGPLDLYGKPHTPAQ